MHINFFAQYPEIIACTSVKSDGDMRNITVRDRYLRKRGIEKSLFISAKQVHGTRVNVIDEIPTQQLEGDGLITGEKGIYVGVVTADCVPVFFYEPQQQLYGIAHAGWKGVYDGIIPIMMQQIEKHGGSRARVHSAVGPHIGSCCYIVDANRAALFRQRFGSSNQLLYPGENAWHLDLGFAVVEQLVENGLKRASIETPLFCTSCQADQFFSFRKNPTEGFGEMISIIGSR